MVRLFSFSVSFLFSSFFITYLQEKKKNTKNSHAPALSFPRLHTPPKNETKNKRNETKKQGVKVIKTYAERMRGEGVRRAVVVAGAPLTPFARQCLAEMAPRYQVEVFQEQELLVNVTHHVLVPPHTVLSAEEKAALLRRYRVREAQLPRIQFNDPVARYHGLARGQVVRIVRPSETAGRYVTYRLCV